MKTAIAGSSGYLAGFLMERLRKDSDFQSILLLGRESDADAFLDLTDTKRFDYACLDGVDFVAMTAAVSSPDKCASDYDFCWTVNVTGTVQFIREAVRRGCHVLFFSSDAVFGDIPGRIYDEKSETLADTPYGRMKKAVEDEFKEEPLFKAVRLSYVVSHRDRFVTYCRRCIESGEEADVFHPFYRNVIAAGDVANAVAWMAKHWAEYEPGVLNLAGAELVSRVRIADEMNRMLGGALQYRISRPSPKFYANRAAITQMRSLYLEAYGILPRESFTEKMQRAIRSMIND